MRSILLLISILIVGPEATSQVVIHNIGNLKLHEKGSLGFHSDLVNDGSFDQNLGFMGFYRTEDPLFISGAFSPSFYDIEIAVEDHLYLNVPIHIDNSLQFIYGNIKSSRNKKSIYSKFTEKAYYDGVFNSSKIDGYVAVEDQITFKFPVGQRDVLKPLELKFIDEIFMAKCGYFNENPDYPRSVAINMDTKKRDNSLGAVNDQEFWYMSTSGRIQLTIHWDIESSLSSYADDLGSIAVAAWSRQNKIWDNLGNADIRGSMEEGFVTSHIFNANDYEYFTLGFLFNSKANEPGNYAISPNGDGINDFFSLKIIDQSPHNDFKVFNRAGLLVYEKSNYKDEFRGIGNINNFKSNDFLPEGVYFYLLELKDLNQKYQGYFYLVVE